MLNETNFFNVNQSNQTNVTLYLIDEIYQPSVNPKPPLHDMISYTKFEQNWSINAQDRARK